MEESKVPTLLKTKPGAGKPRERKTDPVWTRIASKLEFAIHFGGLPDTMARKVRDFARRVYRGFKASQAEAVETGGGLGEFSSSSLPAFSPSDSSSFGPPSSSSLSSSAMLPSLVHRDFEDIEQLVMSMVGVNLKGLKNTDELRVAFLTAYFTVLFMMTGYAKYASRSEFLTSYPSFEQETAEEKRKLMDFANMFAFLVSNGVTMRGNKGVMMVVVPRMLEGKRAKYVTGGGAKKSTRNRIYTYEREGSVTVIERPSRRKMVLQLREDAGLEPLNRHGEAVSSSSSSQTKKKKKATRKSVKRTSNLAELAEAAERRSSHSPSQSSNSSFHSNHSSGYDESLLAGKKHFSPMELRGRMERVMKGGADSKDLEEKEGQRRRRRRREEDEEEDEENEEEKGREEDFFEMMYDEQEMPERPVGRSFLAQDSVSFIQGYLENHTNLALDETLDESLLETLRCSSSEEELLQELSKFLSDQELSRLVDAKYEYEGSRLV